LPSLYWDEISTISFFTNRQVISMTSDNLRKTNVCPLQGIQMPVSSVLLEVLNLFALLMVWGSRCYDCCTFFHCILKFIFKFCHPLRIMDNLGLCSHLGFLQIRSHMLQFLLWYTCVAFPILAVQINCDQISKYENFRKNCVSFYYLAGWWI